MRMFPQDEGTSERIIATFNQARDDGATQAQLQPTQDVFNELASVLGLELQSEARGTSNADPFIDLLVGLRAKLRAERNWALSDELRDELKLLGVVLEDGKDGTTWSWG